MASTLIKVILIICIVFVASRNFSLHRIAVNSVTEQRDYFERERRESFVVEGRHGGNKGNDQAHGSIINKEELGVSGRSMTKIERMSQKSLPAKPTIQFVPEIVPSNLSELPAALQPVTYQECCPLLTRPPKKPKCGEICLTESACNNTLYPFNSVEEMEFLKPMATESKEGLRGKCNKMNSMMEPPYQWCQQLMDNSFMRKSQRENKKSLGIDPLAAKLPPPGCSIFNNGGGSGSYQHLMLFPGAKLAFCGIPKVGITQWLQFLRFTFGAKDYLSSPHIKGEVFAMRFDKINEEAQMKILNDPEWKFVAFLRDPAERLLSAYLDKVSSKKLEREHFQKQHGLNRTLDFDEFLNILAEKPKSCPDRMGHELDRLKGVNWCTNPHWRPQTYSCGMSEFLPRFSFVGSLNHIDTQVRTMLNDVGLWESHGKYYHWHKDKKSASGSRCISPPPSLKVGEKLFGFQQKPKSSMNDTLRASDTGYGHATDSKTKMDTYYTPEMLKKVKELYKQDYMLWDLVNEEKLHSGVELAMGLSDDCRATV